jgi:hypothetical protein
MATRRLFCGVELIVAGEHPAVAKEVLYTGTLRKFVEQTNRRELSVQLCGTCSRQNLTRNVVCWGTAIRLESGAKRNCQARALNVADDPKANSVRPLDDPKRNSHAALSVC